MPSECDTRRFLILPRASMSPVLDAALALTIAPFAILFDQPPLPGVFLIKGLLCGQGIRGINVKSRYKTLTPAALVTADGGPLPERLGREIAHQRTGREANVLPFADPLTAIRGSATVPQSPFERIRTYDHRDYRDFDAGRYGSRRRWGASPTRLTCPHERYHFLS